MDRMMLLFWKGGSMPETDEMAFADKLDEFINQNGDYVSRIIQQ